VTKASRQTADAATATTPPIPENAKAAIPLGLKTYKGAVYDVLSTMIAELELRPGERLVEAELAARFQVSKTPIREAFLLLEADGLVELSPYVGARVTWMSVDNWEEQLFIFDALEQPALPRVAERITRTELTHARRLVTRMRRYRADRDGHRYRVTLWEVHRTLFASTGFPRLLQMILDAGRSNARRYQRVFIHQFDDAWDIELELIAGRVEGIARHEPAAAAEIVAEGHRRLIELARMRTDDPRVAPFLHAVAAR
jgi:DNA-binding GntR family transcriptional regulator